MYLVARLETAIDPSTVCVMLPVHAERENLSAMVAAIRREGPYGILIVEDGSLDGTAEVAEALARELPGVHLLRYDRRVGFGPSCRRGFARALELDYARVLTMDADFQHDPADIPRLVAAVDAPEPVDLVIGSRYVPGGSIPEWQIHRRALSRGGNWIAGLAITRRIHDFTGGFRCYRASALGKIPFDEVTSNGYAFLIETAAAFCLSGRRVREVAIRFGERQAGVSKMSGAIAGEALVGIARILFRRIADPAFYRSGSGRRSPH